MKLRELGKTGIQLPAVGLGTWQYRAGVAPLRAGIVSGARFIDTAESYGSEEVVGQAIRGIRKDIFLATKVSPRHFRYSDVIKAANESLRRLNTDYLDLYQLHWPNYAVPLEETLGALETLTNGDSALLAVTQQLPFDGTVNQIVADLVRNNLVLFHCSARFLQIAWHEIAYADKPHLALIIAHSPLATGLPSIKAKDPENVLTTIASRKSRSVAQIALNWCLSHTGIVTIPKGSSVAHVTENCAAADFQLDEEELHLLNSKVRFRRRGPIELALRRVARQALQLTGQNQ